MNPRETEILHSFFRHLAIAVSNASLYSPRHRQVSRMCALALADMKSLAFENELSVMLVDGELIANGSRLEAGLYTDRLARSLRSLGIGHLGIRPAVTAGEIEYLVTCLIGNAEAGEAVRSSDNIRFGTVAVCFTEGAAGAVNPGDNGPEVAGLLDFAGEELARLMEIYEEARKNRKLRIGGVVEIVDGFIKAFMDSADPLLAIAPLRSMDEYSYTHSTNVCILNLAQAMALGLEGPMLQEIGVAAMLHDVGKLFIPEEILTKPGRLDDREWQLIQQHPLKGAQYLLDTPGAPQLAVVTAYEHHMKFDFSGYPRVDANWRQNICSHMTSISDFFDALRTRRTYRGSLELGEIAGIMAETAGKELHPVLTRHFLQVFDKISLGPSQLGAG